LSKGRIDEERRAGQRQPNIDVVQEKEGRERPQLIEDEQKRPNPEEFSRAPGAWKSAAESTKARAGIRIAAVTIRMVSA